MKILPTAKELPELLVGAVTVGLAVSVVQLAVLRFVPWVGRFVGLVSLRERQALDAATGRT